MGVISCDIKELTVLPILKLQEDGFWCVVGNVVVGDRSSYFGDQGNCVVLCLAKSCCQAEIEDGEATADAGRDGLWPTIQPASLHWGAGWSCWRGSPTPTSSISSSGRFRGCTSFFPASWGLGPTPTLWSPGWTTKCSTTFLCPG